jgi:hypothetical protein
MNGIPALTSKRSVTPRLPLTVIASVRIRSVTVSMSKGVDSPLRMLAVETSVPSWRLRPSMVLKVVVL